MTSKIKPLISNMFGGSQTNRINIKSDEGKRAFHVVLRIHVKNALNVVKSWNSVRMKLLLCRSRIDLGAFLKLSPSVCVPI